jgi:hypothetical protein
MKCAICEAPLDKMDEFARQHHYDMHFQTQEQSKQSLDSDDVQITDGPSILAPQDPSSTSESPRRIAQIEEGGKKLTFWTVSRAPHQNSLSNYTPNLIGLLRHALAKTHARSLTQRAALCREGLCHISSELMDRTWACG